MIRVTAPWRATHDPALRVAQGDLLEVGRRDEEWPGWVWCTDRGGIGGWLPEEVVGDGRASADFDTREFTVAEGDLVQPLERRSGWTWCRSEDGEGWVPDRCLRGAPPPEPPARRGPQGPSEASPNS